MHIPAFSAPRFSSTEQLIKVFGDIGASGNGSLKLRVVDNTGKTVGNRDIPSINLSPAAGYNSSADFEASVRDALERSINVTGKKVGGLTLLFPGPVSSIHSIKLLPNIKQTDGHSVSNVTLSNLVPSTWGPVPITAGNDMVGGGSAAVLLAAENLARGRKSSLANLLSQRGAKCTYAMVGGGLGAIELGVDGKGNIVLTPRELGHLPYNNGTVESHVAVPGALNQFATALSLNLDERRGLANAGALELAMFPKIQITSEAKKPTVKGQTLLLPPGHPAIARLREHAVRLKISQGGMPTEIAGPVSINNETGEITLSRANGAVGRQEISPEQHNAAAFTVIKSMAHGLGSLMTTLGLHNNDGIIIAGPALTKGAFEYLQRASKDDIKRHLGIEPANARNGSVNGFKTFARLMRRQVFGSESQRGIADSVATSFVQKMRIFNGSGIANNTQAAPLLATQAKSRKRREGLKTVFPPMKQIVDWAGSSKL